MAVDEAPKTIETEPKLEVIIRPQTAEEEFGYLKWVLGQLPWYAENGYTLGLPDSPLLRQPAKPEELADKLALFKAEEYKPEYFANGIQALEQNRWRIEAPLPTFLQLHEAWGFKVFPAYDITLTKYGPGGMYHEDTGRVVMLTTAQGTFKRGHPSHTPVHEMVHIGIEDGIVKHFGLSHWEKERTVDLIVFNLFGEVLPGYEPQDKGDRKIDPYVNTETIWHLPEAIGRFVAENPR